METTYQYNVWNGNAPDPAVGADPFLNETTVYQFTNPDGSSAATKILHVWAVDQNLLIRFSYRSATLVWGDPITIQAAAQSQDFFHSAQAWQVVNAVFGATAWYQVLGMW